MGGAIGLFSRLIKLIYEVLFLKGEEGYRLVPISIKMTYYILMFACLFISGNSKAIIVLWVIWFITAYFWPGLRWVLSVSLLSSIPALWYATSAYLSFLLGLTKQHTALITIFMKTLMFSLIFLHLLVSVSPAEISRILFRVRRQYTYMPLLTWYVIPHVLSQFLLSLEIGKLKREGAVNRLPSGIAASIEISDEIERNTILKRSLQPTFKLQRGKTRRELCLITVMIIVLLLFMMANLYYNGGLI